MIDVRQLWRQAVQPVSGFQISRAADLGLGCALGRMLLLRVPVAVLDGLLTYWSLRALWAGLRALDGEVASRLAGFLPPDYSIADLRATLAPLPELPAFGSALPWLLLVPAAGILGLWMHHAVWDHTCLWMIGGLKAGRGFRATLIAEAEALGAGVFGALLGLLAVLPFFGCLFGTLSALAAVWFWGLRGVALAAYHDCPVWKGILATVLHGLLVAAFALGLAVLMGWMLLLALRGT